MVPRGEKRRATAPAVHGVALHAIVVLVALTTLPLAPARAQDSGTATVGATTDSALRGISPTYGGPACRRGPHYRAAQGRLAGVWGSNVDPCAGGAPAMVLRSPPGLPH